MSCSRSRRASRFVLAGKPAQAIVVRQETSDLAMSTRSSQQISKLQQITRGREKLLAADRPALKQLAGKEERSGRAGVQRHEGR